MATPLFAILRIVLRGGKGYNKKLEKCVQRGKTVLWRDVEKEMHMMDFIIDT